MMVGIHSSLERIYDSLSSEKYRTTGGDEEESHVGQVNEKKERNIYLVELVKRS